MVTTRTLGPLHLEDLEPHRFEDLVRQLLYDFRQWRTLEATGRSGADDGFDARGIETIPQATTTRDDDQEEDQIVGDFSERVWLVQCKREKEIGPQKLVKYLDDIVDPGGLYGVVFAAACDFSKKARDGFRDKVRELGIAEAHLWGKAEIEDQLFQPKNDHLLFAYFGVSLQSRRRTLKTAIRSILATKMKAARILKGHENRPVLVRDATDERYPWLDVDPKKKQGERRRWHVMTYIGSFHDGLHFIVARHPAFVNDDGEAWDYAEKFNSGQVRGYDNPWERDSFNPEDARSETFDIWDALPEGNKFWYFMYAIMPFENILDIDEHGDDWFDKPQIYTVEWGIKSHPFSGFQPELRRDNAVGNRSMLGNYIAHIEDKPVVPDLDKRINKFARRVE